MIYIVEDDDSIRELEEYVLRSAGFTVQGFTNARDFWAACAQQPPRLTVLDIMLPDEDGMSILHKLRADPATRALPVMLVTAKGAELDRVRGLEDGADDYLAKPFGVMEFSARIKALLRRSGQVQYLTMEHYTPGTDEDELNWQQLWKRFFKALTIEQRRNERCQRTHCPRRFWQDMCEMQGGCLESSGPKDTGTSRPPQLRGMGGREKPEHVPALDW